MDYDEDASTACPVCNAAVGNALFPDDEGMFIRCPECEVSSSVDDWYEAS